MSWFRRAKPDDQKLPRVENGERRVRTEGLWQKCDGCRQIIWKRDLEANWNVCPKCGRHFRIDAATRLKLLLDDGCYETFDTDLRSSDPLGFTGKEPYRDKLASLQKATGLTAALISATGKLDGRDVQMCAMEPTFIGGSMASVEGEIIARAVERALERSTPLIIVSASGGMRMQEGAVSLMQMAKISAALMRLDEAHLPYISVLTDPTTGGVTASYGMLGDLNLAEPGALIGFAGPRVIEQTIRQKLPEGFQRSEFLLKHGVLDAVVPRAEMKPYIAKALRFFWRLMNYPDSVQFLYALGNEIKTAKLGLERIRTVLNALGRPQDRCRFVHVAGTNGKGSTCAMIESALGASGLRTGLFTSPHLFEPTERIRVAGQPISAPAFAAAFDRVHVVVERLLAAGEIDLHTTYFETVTAMALVIFAEQATDMVVLEVGLGGRLDATNVVQPELCVVTPVDFDHEQYLGRSLEAIAGEKAGILKPGVPAVFSRQRPQAAAVLERRAEELGIAVARTADWKIDALEIAARASRFQMAGQARGVPCLLHIHCPLPGEHQVENAATAAVALAELGVPGAAIEAGIARTQWPGRLERISERPEIILDGAHNPAGARALAAYIDRFYSRRRVRLIYGTMRDKAVAEIGGILFPRAWQVIVTAPSQPRALSPEALCDLADHPNLSVAHSLEDALELVRNASPDDVIFITGSLFLVAEARALLGQ